MATVINFGECTAPDNKLDDISGGMVGVGESMCIKLLISSILVALTVLLYEEGDNVD